MTRKSKQPHEHNVKLVLDAKAENLYNKWMGSLSDHVESSRSISISEHDIRVIEVDVSRCAAHWDIHRHLSISKRVTKRRQLKNLIQLTGQSVKGFRYYQGLHEVALVILEISGDDVLKSLDLLQRIVKEVFMQFVLVDFHLSLLPMLQAIEFLVSKENIELYECIAMSGGQYHFAVPWILTWFAHSLDKFSEICFVFSFLIESSTKHDRSMIIYLCTAVILLDAKRIMKNADDTCHVLNCVHSSVRNVSLREAAKLAKDIRIRIPGHLVLQRLPHVKFLYENDAESFMQSVRKLVPVALVLSVVASAFAFRANPLWDSVACLWSNFE